MSSDSPRSTAVPVTPSPTFTVYASVVVCSIALADERDRAQVVALAQHDATVVVVDQEAQLLGDRLADAMDVVEPVQLAGQRLQHLHLRDRAQVARRRRRVGTLRRRVVVVEHEAVLAVRLRRHHPGLGAHRELARVHRVLGTERDPDRDGHRARRLELLRAEARDEPAGERERGARVARRHDHAELLAADAADDVGAAHGVPGDPARPASSSWSPAPCP